MHLDSELASLAEQCRDPLIGWCSFHPQPIDEPSLLHKRVTHSLTQHCAGQPSRQAHSPNLFCLLRLVKEHHEATVTLQYEGFLLTESRDRQQTAFDVTSGRVLVPIPVETLDFGDARGEAKYQTLCPSSFNFLSTTLEESDAMRCITDVEALPIEPQKMMINDLQRQCQRLQEEYERNVIHVRNGVQELHRRKEELARLKALTQLPQ